MPILANRVAATATLVGIVALLVAVAVAWLYVDRRGTRRRVTIPAFLIATFVLLVIYPKLVP